MEEVEKERLFAFDVGNLPDCFKLPIWETLIVSFRQVLTLPTGQTPTQVTLMFAGLHLNRGGNLKTKRGDVPLNHTDMEIIGFGLLLTVEELPDAKMLGLT